ncbi:MAG TPA: hypothetical protein VFL91_18840, partial [Thermomicrobiales bacterium]|nr:hypothetical protein [Thermomicrobiales bacterium]
PSPGEAGGTNDPSGTNGDPTGGQVEACVPSPVGGDLCARASLPIPSPAQLAQAALQALVNLAWGPLIGALIRGFYSVVAGDAFGEASRQIAGLLLGTPDLLVASGGMENVQRLVDVCRDAALALCVALFAFTALQAMLGNVVAPAGLLGRLVAVLFAVGFYRDLVRWLLRGADALTQGVLAIGQDRTTDLFAALLTATEPFWMLLGLVGAVLVIVLGVVKILGLGFLLLTYVVGPVLLPLALHPRAAGFVEVWAEHFVKALLWPALWAIELRLFGALIGGLGLVSGASATATLRGNVVAGLATLATVWLLLVTPWGIHTKLTLRQTVGVVVRTVGAGALLAATGGSAATITAAAAHGLRSRRAAPTAEAHSEGQ